MLPVLVVFEVALASPLPLTSLLAETLTLP
jgi:hypothetical protein